MMNPSILFPAVAHKRREKLKHYRRFMYTKQGVNGLLKEEPSLQSVNVTNNI